MYDILINFNWNKLRTEQTKQKQQKKKYEKKNKPRKQKKIFLAPD